MRIKIGLAQTLCRSCAVPARAIKHIFFNYTEAQGEKKWDNLYSFLYCIHTENSKKLLFRRGFKDSIHVTLRTVRKTQDKIRFLLFIITMELAAYIDFLRDHSAVPGVLIDLSVTTPT